MPAAQYTPMSVGDGDARLIFVPGIVKPINCGSARAADLIVKRVNAHDDMLAALKAIVRECGPMAGVDPDDPGTINAVARFARAAIAKAQQ